MINEKLENYPLFFSNKRDQTYSNVFNFLSEIDQINGIFNLLSDEWKMALEVTNILKINFFFCFNT